MTGHQKRRCVEFDAESVRRALEQLPQHPDDYDAPQDLIVMDQGKWNERKYHDMRPSDARMVEHMMRIVVDPKVRELVPFAEIPCGSPFCFMRITRGIRVAWRHP